MIEGCAIAVGLVLGLTALFLVIGRSVLGEGVIALLYLVPIGWSTTRWGQLAGMSAAVAACLTFNFCFIPPFYTFQIGSVEGWLMLIIFLTVATIVVGRIQYGLQRAHVREREALFMYELSTSLAGARTPETVARTLARQLQQMLQAELVQVVVEPDRSGDSIMVGVPTSTSAAENPDQVLPSISASSPARRDSPVVRARTSAVGQRHPAAKFRGTGRTRHRTRAGGRSGSGDRRAIHCR